MFALFLACAPPDATDHAFLLGSSEKVSKTTTLTVDVDGAEVASVGFVQFTFSKSAYTNYSVLGTKAVSGGTAKFSLASDPDPSYVKNGGGSSVLLALLAYNSDGDVVGVSEDILGWCKTAPTGASSAGWLVGNDGLTGTVSSHSDTSAGIEVEHLFTGDDSIDLKGSTTVESFSKTARLQAVPVDASATSPADWKVAKKWSVALSGTPSSGSITSNKEYRWAWFPLGVYDDTNSSGIWDRSTEKSLGVVCHGSSQVILRWVDTEDDDLDAIVGMFVDSAAYGWAIGKMSGKDRDEISENSNFQV